MRSEHGIVDLDDCAHPLGPAEGGLKLVGAVRGHDLELDPQTLRRHLSLLNVLDVASIGRSREKRDARERRQHLLEDLKPLAHEIGKNGGQSDDVAARSRQACDHSRLDRIDGGDEDDGHRAAGVPEARITSTLRRISSAARLGSCSTSAAILRSNTKLLPSTCPSSLRPCRSGSMKVGGGGPMRSKPTPETLSRRRAT